MPWLPYVTDQVLENEVAHILSVASAAVRNAKKNFHKNVIDPFSVVFETGGFKLPGGVIDWELSEEARQSQKTLSTEYGLFHQRILGHVQGWTNLGTGNVVDLVCQSKKIIAEVKNKHNTTKGSDKVTIYDDLESQVMPKGMQYQGYTAYYVEIVPKKTRKSTGRYNMEFTPSARRSGSRRHPNPLIRQVDGKSFYEIVTGVPDAIDMLYRVLPQVIQKVNGHSFHSSDLPKLSHYFNKVY
jgi:hypothetical protein